MAPISDPARARRLARTLISDLMVYNPEKIAAGLRNDDLFERLSAELSEARAFFEDQVDPGLAQGTSTFEHAIVDVLIYRSRNLRTRIW